jgi:SPP1 gp7 family putative phage head morphogenesis protein
MGSAREHVGITADPLKFAEAVKAFRRRVPMSNKEWDRLEADERQRGFTVGAVAQADVVQDVFDAIGRAVEDGTTFEDFQAEIGGKLAESWGGEDAPRVECLPGDNLVSGAVIRAAHRRRYEGRIAEVVTARGRKFTATPNHPMLTRRGWVAAGKLREGDDLIGYRGKQDRGSPGHQDEEQPPTSIAEVFDALSSSRVIERVHGHRLDFHGDGADGDVDVVSANRPLMVGDFAPLRKPLEQLAFPVTDLARPRFCQRCGHLIVVTQRCGFCDRPVRSTSALKAFSDRLMARVEIMGDAVRAFSSSVARQQFINGQILALAGWRAPAREEEVARRAQLASQAGLLDRSRHPHETGRHRSRDLPEAQASEVEFDRVRSVRFGMFGGHVFNLSTAHGYYALNGLYTGNTIFRTNVLGAYTSGRHEIFSSPAVKEARPVWRFDAIEDDRIDDECAEADGTVLPADDPWWSTHLPPLHMNCRCNFTALTPEEADDEGMTEDPPEAEADEGFGSPPADDEWSPNLSRFSPELRAVLADRLR